MNILYVKSAENVANGSVSIEPDGTVWTGTEKDKTFIDTAKVQAEYERLQAEAKQQAADKAAGLAKLAQVSGLTEAELAALGL